jgi:4-O-beta-D-mannosyl-D-glucose phosphorylase
MAFDFEKALRRRTSQHAELVELKNSRVRDESGVFERWENPVLTPSHAPLFWRYDLDRRRNPLLLEGLGIAEVRGAAAVERAGKVCLVARLVGRDGHGFFAVAESDNGVDRFRFRDRPLRIPEPPGADPESREADVEPSDMRLTAHEDGWLYGVFAVEGATGERRFGIARTQDLARWERLPDVRPFGDAPDTLTLHPELVRGRYAFYTRARGAGGLSWMGIAYCETVEQAELGEPSPLEGPRPVPGSPGAPPLLTTSGWLHVAQSTRASEAGPLPVLTAFLCELEEPWRVRAAPPGYLLAPARGDEPLPGPLVCAGAVARATREVFLYYASGGSLHVATSSAERLLEHVDREPSDGAGAAADERAALVERNLKLLARSKDKAYRGLRP